MTVWVVRAGKLGERETLALEDSRALIGFDEMGDLSQVTSREMVLDLVQKSYPDFKLRTAQTHAGQISNFLWSIKIDDIFALPLKGRPTIAFGKFVGEYEFLPDNPTEARHTRKIEWICDPVPRSAFSQDLLFQFGAALTVFRVKKNDAERKVNAVLKADTARRAEVNISQSTYEHEETDTLDIEQEARQQISDLIGRKFKGHRMEMLVAEVLKAKGFTVQENKKKGSDGGVDILAGRGPMGFEGPCICVQVKSSDSAIDVKSYDELKGVLQDFKAEHGLLVSWGGFNGKVEEKARRDYFKIRLWTASDLVSHIQEVYLELPKEVQAELPMHQIWTLLEDD